MINIQDNVKYWLENKNVSNELKDQISEMNDDDKSLSFSDDLIKFGTAGYRAIMGPGNKFLNEWTYKQLTIAYAKFLKEKFPNKETIKILVGHDNRKNGVFFAEIIASTLINLNFEVYFYDSNEPIATPIISYIIKKNNLDGGINITASHNPKEYNGFKAYNNLGGQLLPNESDRISNLLENWKTNLNEPIIDLSKKVKYIDKSILQEYFKEVISEATFSRDYKDNNKIKVVYTAHHGAASFVAEELLKDKLNYDVIKVKEQCFYDTLFINSPYPNPEDEKSFDLALEYAEKNNANIILGFDPDADRLGIVVKHKDKWNFLSGNQAGTLLSYYILKNKDFKNKTPAIISTYVSTNIIDELKKIKDVQIIRTGTGFKFIAEAIDLLDKDKTIYCIGFEEAIGSCPSDLNRDKDGFQTAALVMEVYKKCQEKNMTLIDYLNDEIYPQIGFIANRTISTVIKGNDWLERAESLKQLALQYNKKNLLKRNIIDIKYNEAGECIEWHLENNSWIKFRTSGTEPKFKMYFNLRNENYDGDSAFIIEQLNNEINELRDLIINELKI